MVTSKLLTVPGSKGVSVDLVTVNGTTTVGTVHEVPTSELILPQLTNTATVDTPKPVMRGLWIILALVAVAMLVGGVLYTQRDRDESLGSAEEGDARAMVAVENVMYEAGPIIAPYGEAESKQGAESFDGFNDGSANA
eukprot:gene1694-34609_t